jgi:uncharacterized protein (TIGR03083 family)
VILARELPAAHRLAFAPCEATGQDPANFWDAETDVWFGPSLGPGRFRCDDWLVSTPRELVGNAVGLGGWRRLLCQGWRMRLSPVYRSTPFIDIVEEPGAIVLPLARQRRRLVGVLRSLDAEQLTSGTTRCEGWAPRDVASHLDTADGFWAWSAAASLAGTPTTLLADFDPVAGPAQMAAGDARSASEVIDALEATIERLIATLEDAHDDAWTGLAEGPPGHISLTAMAHHALWDGWTHERDVLVPLGEEPPIEPDEIAGALRYAAALSPAFSLSLGAGQPATLAIRAIDPSIDLTVEVTDAVVVRPGAGDPATLTLDGDALTLTEALTSRGELAPVPPEHAWLVSGLRTAFDQL